jgi:(p)ppGpp synthase/HD superfamily hydrolase
MDNYDKLFTGLKYYLLGRKYNMAVKALEFARKYHSGLRKDGKSKELTHQLSICHYIMTLKDVQSEEKVLTCALLHDVMEDYNIPVDVMNEEFSPEITKTVLKLSKVYQGKKKDIKVYFEEISQCPVASIVKGADRIHNLQNMVGVFSIAKQKEYVKEVEEYFMPMIKKASYNFPQQTEAYLNIKHFLKSQMELIKAIHNSANKV